MIQRNKCLDICKFLLAIFVVFIHSRIFLDISPELNFISTNGIFRIAVPLFLLISGYYFFDTLKKQKVKRWAIRLGCLYLLWMFIYSVMWFNPGPHFSLWHFGLTLLFGYGHLWYLSGALGAGFIVILTKELPLSFRIVLLVLCYSCGVALQYTNMAGRIEFDQIPYFQDYWSYRNWVFFAFPFFGIGYLIRELKLSERYSLNQLSWLSIFSVTLIFLESYLVSQHMPDRMIVDGEVGVDLMASLIIAAPSIFLWVKKVGEHWSGGNLETKSLAMYSSAIYFSHILVLNTIRTFIALPETLLAIVVLLATLVVSWVLIKINRFKPYFL